MTLLSFCIWLWFWIMHCCIPTPTTDNNTSTGMVWVTLNMGRSAANCQGNVMELSGNFTLSGEFSPCKNCCRWMSNANHCFTYVSSTAEQQLLFCGVWWMIWYSRGWLFRDNGCDIPWEWHSVSHSSSPRQRSLLVGSAASCKLRSTYYSQSLLLLIDNIWAVMTDCRIGGKLIRTILCRILYHNWVKFLILNESLVKDELTWCKTKRFRAGCAKHG